MPARGTRRRRAAWLLPAVLGLLAWASAGCLASTVNHLWATRKQFLAFDQHFRYIASTPRGGPALLFLHPKLDRRDVSAIASGRKPTRIRPIQGGELWLYRWNRRPPEAGPPLNLELEFQAGLLVRLRVDGRFARHLGDGRVEMLLRSFTGKATELDLFAKRVWCRVPAAELERFPALRLADLRGVFGQENLVRLVPLPEGEPSHLWRYTLEGTQGDKADMSFGASLDPHGRADVVSGRIGSFTLAFDLGGVRP